MVKGELIGLIAPHAGYQFSGQTAAFAYKNLIGRNFDTVILIGSSHYSRFAGVSVVSNGFFETPLGRVAIDENLAEKIIKNQPELFIEDIGQKEEHSLEVQLPFLQKTLKDFKIAPFLFGNSAKKDYQLLAKAILKAIEGKKVLLIASSDLSHYPSAETAATSDKMIIRAILSGNIEKLESEISLMENEKMPGQLTFACGLEAIKTVMAVTNNLGVGRAELLNYSHSGEISGDNSKVVGYASIGFWAAENKNESWLGAKDKSELIRVVGDSVKKAVCGEKIPDFKSKSRLLNENFGVFVTIKKSGNLRGCIGCFSPAPGPLIKMASQMAISAAKDPRFDPLTINEVNDLEYEISVLSPLEKVGHWQEIELGKHGVVIRSGNRSGVFLPQVANETGWTLEEFLSQLCFKKAGIDKDGWRGKEVDIFVFTTQIF